MSRNLEVNNQSARDGRWCWPLAPTMDGSTWSDTYSGSASEPTYGELRVSWHLQVEPSQSKKTTEVTMNFSWFRTWGWVFRPASIAGWFMVILGLVFCIQVFLAVDRHSHSVSDTMFGVFPYFSCCFLLLNWLASKTSGRKPLQKT